MPIYLSTLTTDEKELLYKAPLLVCILIAGADGNIDDKEVNKAIQMAKVQDWIKEPLTSYFANVSEDFEDKLKILIQAYPFSPEKRNQAISEELRAVNTLWSKLDYNFAIAYLDMLKYIARSVAASSGSLWGKIGPEERILLNLPMIKEPPKN